MNTAFQTLLRTCAIVAAALLATACGGGSDTPLGTLRVALTDAPSCGFDEVNVTVASVRVHASQTADDMSGGWEEIKLTPPRKIDLLGLNNGILEELGQRAIPAGQYTQLRLVLQPNRGNDLANSVVPTGGAEEPLDTPSGTQTGIKVIRPFTVPAGGLADLVLDFDACKSVVLRGNGTYGLKPVVSASMRAVAEIVGFVNTSIGGVRVSAQSGGNVLRSTAPDSTGAFKLAFLDPKENPTVDVVFVAPGRATAVIGAVPIALQGSTRVSTSAVPVTLPVSAKSGTASGSATPASAVATLRALQAVGPVPKVEVASTNVDLAGDYTLTLPIGEPVYTPFGTLPLTFSTQLPATGGHYTLEASADGYATQNATITLTDQSPNVTHDFTLTPAP